MFLKNDRGIGYTKASLGFMCAVSQLMLGLTRLDALVVGQPQAVQGEL